MRLQRRSVSPLADQDEVVWIADGFGERVANTTRLTRRATLGFNERREEGVAAAADSEQVGDRDYGLLSGGHSLDDPKVSSSN